MTVVPAQQSGGGGGTSGLYDVLELVLDRGLVIDAFVRVSLVGIEILKIDVRVVVASVDTYLRFAEVQPPRPGSGAPQVPRTARSRRRDHRERSPRQIKGALSGAAQTISEAFKQAREEGEAEPRRPRKTAARRKEEEE